MRARKLVMSVDRVTLIHTSTCLCRDTQGCLPALVNQHHKARRGLSGDEGRWRNVSLHPVSPTSLIPSLPQAFPDFSTMPTRQF